MAEGIDKRGKGWSIVIPYVDPVTGMRLQMVCPNWSG